jgi:hypothetical protein
MYHSRRKAGCLLLLKPTKSQQNYTVMEKEMLSIVATLEEFLGMLLGLDLPVFKDRKNLMFNTLKTQCILGWHMKVDEVSPMLHYIEDPHNILADNLHGSVAKSLRLRSRRGRNS